MSLVGVLENRRIAELHQVYHRTQSWSFCESFLVANTFSNAHLMVMASPWYFPEFRT